MADLDDDHPRWPFAAKEWQVDHMSHHLDMNCHKAWDWCTKFPEWMYYDCESVMLFPNCYEKVSTAVKKHCVGHPNSPVCSWITTTRKRRTVTTTTVTSTQRPKTTTERSANTMIIAGLFGVVVFLVFIIMMIFCCRKSPAPNAQDVHAVEANTGKKKGEKTKKTTTDTFGTAKTTKKIRHMDSNCHWRINECTTFPDRMMTKCEDAERSDCFNKIREAVSGHCVSMRTSSVCEWLRKNPTTTTVTTTRITTTPMPTTTTISVSPYIIGGLIGLIVSLVIFIVMIVFCRRRPTPNAPDVHVAEANTTRKKTAQKTKKTTTNTFGTTKTTKKTGTSSGI